MTGQCTGIHFPCTPILSRNWRFPDMPKYTLAERFWRHVLRIDDLFSCWEWTGSRFANGYGQFGSDKTSRMAHRIAYRLAFGEFDNSLYVCHKCDNPPCVRPNHLFLGSGVDNMQDALRKGRHVPARAGDRNPNAKLTAQQVREMRQLFVEGWKQAELIARFSVSSATVWHIVHNKSYTGVN